MLVLLWRRGWSELKAFAHDRVFPRVALAGVDYGFMKFRGRVTMLRSHFGNLKPGH